MHKRLCIGHSRCSTRTSFHNFIKCISWVTGFLFFWVYCTKYKQLLKLPQSNFSKLTNQALSKPLITLLKSSSRQKYTIEESCSLQAMNSPCGEHQRITWKTCDVFSLKVSSLITYNSRARTMSH